MIYRTLAECGLDHDEGPDVGGPVAPYIQTERRDTYGKYAPLLVEKGHAYYCFCEKTESEEDAGEFDRPDDPCRTLDPQEAQARVDAGEPYVIRQKIPHEGTTTFHDAIFGDITVENKTLDDQVLIKRDGLPTYNFANVVDDHLMGITHVVRGSEYLSSAPKYDLLYQAFGWEVPTYVHCSPVMRDAHNKMSKRHGDPSYEDLKAQGYLTQAILNYVALLGWSPKGELAEQEIFSLKELVDAFELSGVSKSPRHLRHRQAHPLQRPLSALHGPGGVRQGGRALYPPERQKPRPERGGDRRPAPGPVREAHRHPGKGGLLRRAARLRREPVRQQEVQVHPGLLQGDALRRHRHAGQPALLERGHDPRQPGGAGRGPGREERPAHVAGAHRRRGKAVTPGGAVEICHILGRDETVRRLKIGLEKLSQ